MHRLLLVCLLSLPTIASAAGPSSSIVLHDIEALPAPDGVVRTAARQLHWGGGHLVQVEQRWRGEVVEGSQLTLSYDDDAGLRDVFGPLELGFPPVRDPDVSADDAVDAAVHGWADLQGDGELWPPRVELALFREGALVHRAWAVDVSVAEPVGAWRVYIDAHDGRLLGAKQQLWTAQAEVYPSNPAASELTLVELNDVDGDELINDYAYVHSCTDFNDQYWQCEAKEKQAIADEDGNFFFDPAASSSDDPMSELQMFFHLDLVARWFEDEFGFRTDFGLSGDAVEGIVNFDLMNAFYGDADGDGIPEVAFGQGGGIDFAYDADVVYHEFGHGVFGSVVDSGSGRFDEYGRLVAPSGLNEGSADLFSLAITGDPMLGEYAGGSALGSGAIRDLEPDRTCPDDIYGESHRDGEIWASMGWNMIEDEELGGQVTAHAYFGALSRWTDEVTFGSAGEALMDSIDDLLETGFITADQHDRLMGHVEAAGFDDCGRVIALDDGAEPTQAMYGRNGQNGPMLFPLPNQFSIDAPEGAVEIRFYVEELATSDPDFGFKVHVRRGEHVVHAFEEIEGPWGTFLFPYPDEFDFSVEGFDDGKVVELNEDSDPPLVPGATYYFSLTGFPDENMGGWGWGEITLRGEADIIPVEEEPIEEGDGCQTCASSMSGGSAGLALLLLVPAVARRRR